MALALTQLLTEMNTRNISWGVKATDAWGWQPYHLHVPFVLKSPSLNLLEPSGPVQTSNGIAFTLSPALFRSTSCVYRYVTFPRITVLFWCLLRPRFPYIFFRTARFPAGATDFFVPWSNQTGSGFVPASRLLETIQNLISTIFTTNFWLALSCFMRIIMHIIIAFNFFNFQYELYGFKILPVITCI